MARPEARACQAKSYHTFRTRKAVFFGTALLVARACGTRKAARRARASPAYVNGAGKQWRETCRGEGGKGGQGQSRSERERERERERASVIQVWEPGGLLQGAPDWPTTCVA